MACFDTRGYVEDHIDVGYNQHQLVSVVFINGRSGKTVKRSFDNVLANCSPYVLTSEQLMGACEHAHNATHALKQSETLVNAEALRNKEIRQCLNDM